MNVMLAVILGALATLWSSPDTVLDEPAPPDAAESVLRELGARREAVAALTAEFRQTTIMPDDVLTATGTIVYSRPRRLAVRFADPKLVYLIDPVHVHEYDAELGQVQRGSLEDTPEVEVLFASFGEDIERLQDLYDVVPFLPADAPDGAQGLELHPRDRARTDYLFETARLYLRAEDTLPYRIEIVNSPESRVIYELENVRSAETVDPALLSVDLRPGTRIIADGRLVETVGETGKRLFPALPETSPAREAP